MKSPYYFLAYYEEQENASSLVTHLMHV